MLCILVLFVGGRVAYHFIFLCCVFFFVCGESVLLVILVFIVVCFVFVCGGSCCLSF